MRKRKDKRNDKAPNFYNVTRYLDEVYNNTLLTDENYCNRVVEISEDRKFRYRDVIIEYEYEDNKTRVRVGRTAFDVSRKLDVKYINTSYLMQIAICFDRCLNCKRKW